MNPTRLAPTALLLLLVPLAAAQPAGWPDDAGWPEYGGTLARTGHAPVMGPARALEAAGPTALKAASFSAPVVDLDGNVYVGDDAGVVTKLDPTLRILWQTKGLGGPIRSSVALDGAGGVYVAPVGRDLVALDAATGAERWRYAVNNNADAGSYAITAAPAVHPDGFVVQPSMDGRIYGATLDGKKAWDPPTTATDKCVAAPAVAGDGTIYAGCQNGVLYAVRPDGTLKWSYTTNDLEGGQFLNEQQVAAPSIGPDGTVYVTTRLARGLAGAVYALTDAGLTAAEKWIVQLNERITAPVTVHPGLGLFVGDIGGDFYRLRTSDGSIQWRFNPAEDDPDAVDEADAGTPFDILSVAELAVADAAGRVYVTYWHVDLRAGFPPQDSFASPFYALNAQNGAIVWREVFPNTMRSPALVPSDVTNNAGVPHGVLYLAGDDGKVYARATVPPTQGAPIPTASATSPALTSTQHTRTQTQASDASPSPDEGTPGPGALALVVALAGLAAWRRRRA